MSQTKPREDRAGAGVLMMALAVTWFTCIDSSAKWLILGGIPALQVVFVRYLGHAVLAIAAFAPQEGLSAFRSNAPGKQILRSLFLLGSTTLNFTALQYLPITVTTTIMFAGPIVVTLLAIPILGEQVGLRRILAVCAGFVGVLVVMQPWGAEFHPAMLLTLAALCMASLYFIMTRLLAGIEGNAVSQIWSAGLAAVTIFPFVLKDWTWPTGTDWIAFVLVGVFGALGHIAATTAHRWADASILAPVIYIQLFLAAIASVVLFDTWPTLWTLAGGSIIIASGLYIWQRERMVRKGGVRKPVPTTR